MCFPYPTSLFLLSLLLLGPLPTNPSTLVERPHKPQPLKKTQKAPPKRKLKSTIKGIMVLLIISVPHWMSRPKPVEDEADGKNKILNTVYNPWKLIPSDSTQKEISEKVYAPYIKGEVMKKLKARFANMEYHLKNVPSNGKCWVSVFITIWLAQIQKDKASYARFKKKLPELFQKLEKNQASYGAYAKKAKKLLRGGISDDDFAFLKEEIRQWQKAKKFRMTPTEPYIVLDKQYKLFIAKNRPIWVKFQYCCEDKCRHLSLFKGDKKKKLDPNKLTRQAIRNKLQERITIVQGLSRALGELQKNKDKVLSILAQLQKVKGIKKKLTQLTQAEVELLLRFVKLSSQLLAVKVNIHHRNYSNVDATRVDRVLMPKAWGGGYDFEEFLKFFAIHLLELIPCKKTYCLQGYNVYLNQSQGVFIDVIMFLVNNNHFRFFLHKDLDE